ncbi:glycine hydroxymethyltransferase [Propionicicella superfundia]|uniref:glycine hydroxymethyltransferase n=1 Tax=Propionicicella superfundia TaxID=348582 RepID=UPI0003F7C96E|nr:glycine hydroxymethyltransferase [Propionicicella superfundia]
MADLAATASSVYRQALSVIESVEPRIAQATRQELADQRASLKLIASENYASLPVLMTMGTWLSDKYAEGTVGKRFYAGCRNIDTVEAVAAEHARELFGAEYAYAQPHSGIDANLVAYWAILAKNIESPTLERLGAKTVNDLSEADWEELRAEFGRQRVMGMSLDAGGHLTHGFRHNISGKMFQQHSYGTDPETGLIDYDALRATAREFKPLILVAGYSAYPRRVNFAKMREIADEVGATLFVDMAHFAGLVAGKVFTGEENPVGYADIVATTTHKSLRGPRGGLLLSTEEYAPFIDRGCPMVLGGPLGHVMAAKAVALAEARTPAFATYAQAVADNAQTLAEALAARGVTLVTGGTDNHIVLLDVSGFGVTGRQAETALLEAGIVTNRNSVPRDPNGAWYTSGVRIGTPALTSRGFGADEFVQVAGLIADVLAAAEPATTKAGTPSKANVLLPAGIAERTRAAAAELLDANPLYPGLEL